jgi:hypothetical protein
MMKYHLRASITTSIQTHFNKSNDELHLYKNVGAKTTSNLTDAAIVIDQGTVLRPAYDPSCASGSRQPEFGDAVETEHRLMVKL